MEQIIVSGKDRSYPVALGKKILFQSKRLIKGNTAIITDTNIKKLYSEEIDFVFDHSFIITIPAGEKSKTREKKQEIEDILLEKGYGRDTCILALGGGVIGDLAGFTASTYYRGVRLIQIPTTLLAMLDSSIGGKTAVNTKAGKNIIGSFYNPSGVIIDIDFLNTLPEEEFTNGMFEAVKMAASLDKKLFSYIESNIGSLKEPEVIIHIIRSCLDLKKGVVELDPNDSGLRQVLNYGHTVGHAIEAYSKYRIKHGMAVAYGMLAEAKLSNRLGYLTDEDLERLKRLIKRIGLPKLEKPEKELIYEFMTKDKKNHGRAPRFVLLHKIGKPRSMIDTYTFEADKKVVLECL